MQNIQRPTSNTQHPMRRSGSAALIWKSGCSATPLGVLRFTIRCLLEVVRGKLAINSIKV
jgi:hypothetical protein